MADAPEFANAHWGILIVDPERGDTLYSRNAGKLFMPASNMKILTSAVGARAARAGLSIPNDVRRARRGERTARSTGDLVVIGRGDPSVSDHMLGDAMIPIARDRRFDSRRAAFNTSPAASSPAATRFPTTSFGFGWTYDDFEDSYSAPTDELLFNEGFSEIRVKGGARPGDPVQVIVRPANSFPVVHVIGDDRRRTSGRRFGRPSRELAAGRERQLDVGDLLVGSDRRRATRRRSRSRTTTPTPRTSRRCAKRCATAASRSTTPRADTSARARHARDAVVAAAQRNPEGADEAVAESDRRDACFAPSRSSDRSRAQRHARARSSDAQIAQWGVGAERGGHSRRQRSVALRLHLAANDRARPRRHARVADVPAVLRRACRSPASTARFAIA